MDRILLFVFGSSVIIGVMFSPLSINSLKSHCDSLVPPSNTSLESQYYRRFRGRPANTIPDSQINVQDFGVIKYANIDDNKYIGLFNSWIEI